MIFLIWKIIYYFYRGENADYKENACIAKANRTFSNYDSYLDRINLFNKKIREMIIKGIQKIKEK